MQITNLRICNFKSIRDLSLNNIESAMILVGRNSVGKTVVLTALKAISGTYKIQESDYNGSANITMEVTMRITSEDMALMHQTGRFSRFKRYDLWEEDFCQKFPSYKDGEIHFTYIVNRDGVERFEDGVKKNNSLIRELFPQIYYISPDRDATQIQNAIFNSNHDLLSLRSGSCVFDSTKSCVDSFQCIGLIHQKKPEELTAHETARLLEYKLLSMGYRDMMERFNYYFHKNAPQMDSMEFALDIDMKNAFEPRIFLRNNERGMSSEVNNLSAGMKSIYLLSLLEAYCEMESEVPSIILIEDPEMYLHPQLQKSASEILYRLTKKNQVIFTTHSPNLIFNFNSRQLKQIQLDSEGYTIAKEDVDVDSILNDLGYSANDMMNVSFVFIVEGKQDRARLPLLLEKYYGDIYDENGQLNRISIITTNSCTNIKTYANLKYINSVYLKDSFLMIRDGDGKNPNYLRNQLTNYYKQAASNDKAIPRVKPENVLILHYYSFENYFLDPKIMAEIGVVKSENQFYDILWNKWKEYLYKLSSARRLQEKIKRKIASRNDLIQYMEEIRIYVRGHNLYDIFYGKYKGEREEAILKKYIEAAPRDTFKDILDSIDHFVFFDNKKVE
ncbi:MAG: AAA family ATPase [Lachnospiraceae bacterium]|nr:AAA family ATPase [Lachnospiraceae bacterium]